MKMSTLRSVLGTSILGLLLTMGGNAGGDEINRPQEVLKTADINKLTRLLDSYLDESDSMKKEKDLERLRDELDRMAKSKGFDTFLRFPGLFTELIQSTYDFKRSGFLKGKLNSETTELSIRGKSYKNTYHFWLPKSYDPRQPLPLIIALHPKGKTGDSYFAETYENSSLADECAFLLPTLAAETESWSSPEGRIQILALSLAKIWEVYNVDRTRFIIEGAEDSGQQALTLASWYADIFAGVIVRSTTPPDKFFYHNFKHLPVALLVGEKDTEHRAAMTTMEAEFKKAGQAATSLVVVPGAGAGLLGDGSNLIKDWVLARTLTTFPDEITWSATDRGFGRAYWLQITHQEIGDDVVSTVHAKLDRANNKVEIQADQNTLKYVVYLSDEVLDMDKPFSIATNGNIDFQGKKERSLDQLLRSYWVKGDATRLFTNEVPIEVVK